MSIKSKSSSSKAQFAGFNFGKVQDVIDDSQKGIRAGLYSLGKVALLRLKLPVKQETGHTDDAVHGRPDFMAHVGQKFAFSAIGCLRDPAGFFRGRLGVEQLLLGLFVFRNFRPQLLLRSSTRCSSSSLTMRKDS